MPRPFKCRRIAFSPDYFCFKPAGIPGKHLSEVLLTLDELEAIRLADLEGLYQEHAAQQMNISRQTFGNILVSAHKKIADSIINGKILTIEGGHIEMLSERYFTCADCKHEWSVPYGTKRPHACPQCQSANIHRSEKDRGYARHGMRGQFRRGFGNRASKASPSESKQE